MKTQVKRVLMYAALAAVPALWNACGEVGFQQGDAAMKECASTGADLTHCYNNNASFKESSQSLTVDSNKQVDIIFVVDSSGSMTEEQVGIANKINGFLDKIKELDWQIAVTTTDERANTLGPDGATRPWGDGQFRPFDSDTGSQYILRSSQVATAQAQTLLGQAIQVGIKGTGNERGINSTYRAVERASDPGANKDFFRKDAKLAVVVISDEDECSTGLAECAKTSASSASKSDPANMVSLVKDRFGENKGFSFSSIVKIPGDTSCTTGYSEGKVYKDLTSRTNGVMASVCSSDFATPLATLGQKVVNLVKTVTLSCAPQDINGDGKVDFAVKLENGTVVTTGFKIVGNQAEFDTALPEGTHRFYFFCK